MASLNGVSIKNLKLYRGHEGEPLYQGNVYLDGKKVGFWSQDAWGGPDELDFCAESNKVPFEDKARWKAAAERDKVNRCEFDQRVAAYLDSFSDKGESRWRDAECFMGDLLTVCEDEKDFRKVGKKLAGDKHAMVVTSNGWESFINAWAVAEAVSPEKFLQEVAFKDTEYRKMVLESFHSGPVTARAYCAPRDFDITCDRSHPAPDWMYDAMSGAANATDLRKLLK